MSDIDYDISEAARKIALHCNRGYADASDFRAVAKAYAARLVAAETERDALRREATDPADPESKAWQFQEVMAVIHGDGGHCLAQHGPRKAADDAIAMIYALRAEVETLRELLREAREFRQEVLFGVEVGGDDGAFRRAFSALCARIDAALAAARANP